MNIFITADQHFNHDAIRHHARRPFPDVQTMNEALITRHNATVSPRDEWYCLGDFAWNDHLHFLNRLNGKCTLVLGNHDKMPTSFYRQFHQVIGTQNQPGILHKTFNGQFCAMSHFPLESWNQSIHGGWHFHGHCHGTLAELPSMLRCDVGVDIWDYAPVPLDVLVLKMQDRIPAFQEWHARRQERSKVDLAPLKQTNQNWRQLCFTPTQA